MNSRNIIAIFREIKSLIQDIDDGYSRILYRLTKIEKQIEIDSFKNSLKNLKNLNKSIDKHEKLLMETKMKNLKKIETK